MTERVTETEMDTEGERTREKERVGIAEERQRKLERKKGRWWKPLQKKEEREKERKGERMGAAKGIQPDRYLAQVMKLVGKTRRPFWGCHNVISRQ